MNFRGLYHEAGIFRLSLKVALLLAVFIATVTYTPQLTFFGAGYFLGERWQPKIGPFSCVQSDTCHYYNYFILCNYYTLNTLHMSNFSLTIIKHLFKNVYIHIYR